MIRLIGTAQNADRNLTSIVTCWTGTPDAIDGLLVQALVLLGDGVKDLDGTGGIFDVRIDLGSQAGCVHPMTVAAGVTRAWFRTEIAAVPADTAVAVKVLSPNAADSDVDVTVYLYDVLGALAMLAINAMTARASEMEFQTIYGAEL